MDLTDRELYLCVALFVTNACWAAAYVYRHIKDQQRADKIRRMDTIARGVPLPGMAPVPGLFRRAGDEDAKDEFRRRKVPGASGEADG